MRNVEFVRYESEPAIYTSSSVVTNSRGGNRYLKVDEVERDLKCNLPALPFPNRTVSASDVLEEFTLKHIANLLASCPETAKWKARSRIYCLLRLVGLRGDEPVCLSFQDEDIDDLCIPFSDATVPLSLISDTNTCKRFLELQPIVQTRPVKMSFDGSKASTHRSISYGELYFTTVQRLGQRGPFTVDVVRSVHSGLKFIRRSIQRGNEEHDRRSRVRLFRSEIAALQRFNHFHLVGCMGTYTDQTTYALILHPVGNYSLETMLTSGNDYSIPESDLNNLPQYFGCLATAVAFLHANDIQHNDIKPSNILIHDGRVVMCDSDTTQNQTSSEQDRTTEPITGAEMPYSAPEVRLKGVRSASSDIWSLGRIFVELLTIISGGSVKNLDRFLAASDTSSISSSISSGKASSRSFTPERLYEGLVGLPMPAVYAELRQLTARMISREPGQRPSAASVFTKIRRSSPDCVCQSCGEKISPLSPMPRNEASGNEHLAQAGASRPAIEFDTSVRRSQTRNQRTSSIQGSPRSNLGEFDEAKTNRSHRRDNSATTVSRGSVSVSIDLSTRSETLSRHDSAATSTSQNWHIQPDEELDFETTLLSYSIEQGEATYSCKETGIRDGSLKLTLYRTICEQAWQVTRRLVIIDPDGEMQTTRIFSNWLPLADITLGLHDDTVAISWSDCNHDVREPTVNYVETHSKKYDASKPNNKILLKVASSATADAIALMKALCSPVPSCGHEPFQPDCQTRLMDGERVNFFNIADKGQGSIMMVVGGLAQVAKSTKVYSIPQQLDLTIAMKTDSTGSRQLFQAMVSGLLTTSYMSDAQNLSKMTNKKGYFQRVTQVSREAVFTFAENGALFKFLKAVTGWSLMYLAKLPSVREKRKLTHDLGAADMLFWQREGARKDGDAQDIVVMFRLRREDVSERWISGLLPRENAIKKIEGLEAELKLRCSSQGDMLDRQEMRAVSTKNNKATGDKKGDAEQTSKFKVVFSNAQDVAEFQTMLDERMQYTLIPISSLTSSSGRDSSST